MDRWNPSLNSQGEEHRSIGFDELVRGVGLLGPNRDVCRDAFEQAPAGFAELVRVARQTAAHPASLIVWRVKRGEHRILDADINPEGSSGGRFSAYDD